MRYAHVLTLALAVGTAGCSWRRTPVPVFSETGSTALLVGEWSGDYNSQETGRSGSISFSMASEKDTAYCDVVMVPKVHNVRITTTERPDVPLVKPEAMVEPLRVRFIRLGEGKLNGTLDPYTDPECNCRVTTTFDGQFVNADTIKGTYITRGSGLPRGYSGTWKVVRQRLQASTQ
jgi:hypothetical protein